MAIHVNKAIIVGRLGADPERKGTNGDFVTMRVATSSSWKDKQTGERKERTQWHTVCIFIEATGNFIMDYAKKGDLVCVEGAIETRKWEKSPNDNVYFTEIVVRPYTGAGVQLMSQDKPEPDERRGVDRQETDFRRDVQNFSRDIDDEIPF